MCDLVLAFPLSMFVLDDVMPSEDKLEGGKETREENECDAFVCNNEPDSSTPRNLAVAFSARPAAPMFARE